LMQETLTNQIYNRCGNGISTGLGLRVNIPGLGPVKFDYGIPITQLGAGLKKKGRFTFGFGEFY
ncbi:MAG: BamA/TamA family outer membrane protein, partial [Candidatus Gastranaerophilales bacterium]|nr:BamA/TamA family outer membrane protein [Candidatus Gastranaerophilales bacterium]